MLKNFVMVGVAVTATSIPTVAGATTFVQGDTISCSTNTFASSGCNDGTLVPPGRQTIDADVQYGGAPEFFINVVPNTRPQSANPLISVDFDRGSVTLQGLGEAVRRITGTTLTFFNFDKPLRSVSTATPWTRTAGGTTTNRATIVNGALQIDLRGTDWNEDVSQVLNVSAVPEPGTWALMILGLGAVGFSMRRRQRSVARLQFA